MIEVRAAVKVSPPGDIIGAKRGEPRARSDVVSWPVLGRHWSGSMATVPVRKFRKEEDFFGFVHLDSSHHDSDTAARSGSDEAYSDEVAAEQGTACTQDRQLQQGST